MMEREIVVAPFVVAPFEEIEAPVLAHASAIVAETFECHYRIGDRLLVPESAFNPRRRQYSAERILQRMEVGATGRMARSRGIHVEVTTLVIPGVSDGGAALQEIARRIAGDLGPEVPWHVSGYCPAYQFTAPPTPISTLERAWRAGKDAGLEFVYTGNVSGHRGANTHCPACGDLVILRLGYDVLRNTLRYGRCPRCGRHLAGVWGNAGR